MDSSSLDRCSSQRCLILYLFRGQSTLLYIICNVKNFKLTIVDDDINY